MKAVFLRSGALILAAVFLIRDAGVPAQTLEWLGELWRLYDGGMAEAVSPDIEQVTGRPPYSFRQFAEDHRTLWLQA